MMRSLLGLLLLMSGPALAGPFAGVPLDALPGLGLEAPTLDDYMDGWRAPLATGGFVAVQILADADAASAVFAKSAQTLTQRQAPALDVGDEAVGDGESYVFVRFGNVLVQVRTDSGAGAVARGLKGALVAEAPAGLVEQRGQRFDAVGRHLPE